MILDHDDDLNETGFHRTRSRTGDARPERTVVVHGRDLPLYPTPNEGAHGPLPWPASGALFDIIGLAPDARSDFLGRHGLNLPGRFNAVRTPAGMVGTLSPDAALVCVGIAERAGLAAEVVEELKLAISASGEAIHA